MPTTLSTISASKVSMPRLAAYTSQNVNKIHASQPAGILYGFLPSTPAGLTLELEMDETLSASIARVRGSGVSLTVNETSAVTFDLTAYAGTTVYIALNVTYAVNTDTVATYKLYTSAEYASTPNPAETIWICAVTVPSSGSLAASNIDTSVRSRAWKEVPFSEDRDKWEALIQDPYMGHESSLGDYTAQGGATSLVLTDAVVSGALNSIVGTTSGASGNVYRKLHALGAVTPGSTIRYRFYYKATACTATKIGIRFRFMEADRTASFSVNGPAMSATTADWTLYEKEVLVPADCYFVGVEVGAQGLSAGTFYIEQPQVFIATAHPHKRGSSARAVDASILRLMGHVGAGHLYAHSDAEDSVQVKATAPTTITVGSEVAVEFESAPIVPEVTNVLSLSGLALVPLFTYTDSGDGTTVYQFSGGGITIEIGTVPSISFSGDSSSETINAYYPVNLPYDAVITTLRIVGKFTSAGLESTAVATLWSCDNAGGGDISALATAELDAALSTNQTVEETIEHAHQPGETDNRLLLQVSLTVPIVDGTKITLTAVEIVYTVNRIG